MGKIQNDHQLQVSRRAVERLQRALKGYEAYNPKDESGCLESLRIGIRQIEREIEEYSAAKVAERAKDQPLTKVASG